MRILIFHPSDRITQKFRSALGRDEHTVVVAHSRDEAVCHIGDDICGIELALIDENDGSGTFVHGEAERIGRRIEWIFIVSPGKQVTPVKGVRYFPYGGGDCDAILEFLNEFFGG